MPQQTGSPVLNSVQVWTVPAAMIGGDIVTPLGALGPVAPEHAAPNHEAESNPIVLATQPDDRVIIGTLLSTRVGHRGNASMHGAAGLHRACDLAKRRSSDGTQNAAHAADIFCHRRRASLRWHLRLVQLD